MAKSGQLRSMTGYGRARCENETACIQVEIRAVNGRHYRLHAKLPPLLSCLESRLDKVVRQACKRGNVDLYMRYESRGRGGAGMFDIAALEYYRNQLEELKLRFAVPGEVSIELLASMPGALQSDELTEEELDALWPLTEQAVRQALARLDEMRLTEGEGLRDELLARIGQIREFIATLQERIPLARGDYVERLQRRISDLLGKAGMTVEPGDLIREVAIFTERSDMSEELSRLGSHMEQFEAAVGAGGDIGRRLEFLVQEMHREANTMGGKANDAELSRQIIDIKAVVDKLKEQAPNVE